MREPSQTALRIGDAGRYSCRATSGITTVTQTSDVVLTIECKLPNPLKILWPSLVTERTYLSFAKNAFCEVTLTQNFCPTLACYGFQFHQCLAQKSGCNQEICRCSTRFNSVDHTADNA